MTSRPHGYDVDLFTGQVEILLEVQPFTLAQMKDFIGSWYLQTEMNRQRRDTPAVERKAQQQAEDLIEALLQNPTIRKMASNPLLVTMIATVHYLGNALPGKRVALYKEICDVLLGRRLLARKSQLPVSGEKNQEILQFLALSLMERGVQQFAPSEYRALIQPKLDQASGTLTYEQWLKTIKEDVGLLVEKAINSYEFSHLSFQEYLAAVEIKALQREELLIEHLQQPSWGETLRLYAAQTNASPLIEAALQQPNVYVLSLAYDCLEASEEVEPDIRQRLEETLETGLESGEREIAQMAAKVKLTRRLNNLLEIEPGVSIDRDYISVAEYQLFINETYQAEASLPGKNASNTMKGISYERAVGYCRWLTQNVLSMGQEAGESQESYYYRLPRLSELQAYSTQVEPDLQCWTLPGRQGQENGIRVVREQVASEYTKLVNYLEAKEWEKADQETAILILKAAKREREHLLDHAAIEQLSIQDLQVMEQLWQQFSAGRFGIGIQTWIWENLGGNQSGHFPRLQQLDGVRGSQPVWDALMQKAIAAQIQRGLPQSRFEVVSVNGRGEEIRQETAQAPYYLEAIDHEIVLEMMAIPGGQFRMGTEDREIKRLCQIYDQEYFRREQPLHRVSIEAFSLSKYPITQAQWQAIALLPKIKTDLKPTPSNFKGDDQPVEQVSWSEAVEFCDRLTQKTGRQYRLPTEAEWEYACRAGTETPFHFGETITERLANYRASETYANEPPGEYRQATTPVGSFPPNGFGLHDMHGNVWEWCADHWHENYQGAPMDGRAWLTKNDNHSRLLRGGSWVYDPAYCRSALRSNYVPGDRDLDIGFRVVCGGGRTHCP